MRQLSENPRPVDVTGYFLWLYADGQPMLVSLEGVFFVPIYSTPDRAESGRAFAKPAEPVSLKQITNGAEFLAPLIGQVRVMIDPYILNGKTRFTEVFLD